MRSYALSAFSLLICSPNQHQHEKNPPMFLYVDCRKNVRDILFYAQNFCLQFIVTLRFAFVNANRTICRTKRHIQLTSGAHQGSRVLDMDPTLDISKVQLPLGRVTLHAMLSEMLDG